MTPAEAAAAPPPPSRGRPRAGDPRRRPRGARARSATTASPWTPSRSAPRPPRRRSTGAGTPRRRSSSTRWPPRRRRPPVPDTGDLRTDLLAAFCGMGGLTDHDTTADVRRRDDRAEHRPRVRRRVPRPACWQPKAQLSRTALPARRRPRRGPRGPRPRPRRPGAGRDRPAPPLRDRRDIPGRRSSSSVIDQIILPAVRPQA